MDWSPKPILQVYAKALSAEDYCLELLDHFLDLAVLNFYFEDLLSASEAPLDTVLGSSLFVVDFLDQNIFQFLSICKFYFYLLMNH